MKLAGRYRLEAPIGEGGMAEVWRATDEKMERSVAVKMLHAYVHPTERQRFFQEVKALSRLSHPGVVQVFDLGEQEGRTFFVMELVEGGSFDQLGPFEDGMDGLHLLEASGKVLQVLAHLHDKGVVHRDLTPKNILLGPEGQPKVMDFGLAYLLQETRHLTRTGYTLGTPQYMAPEQAKGIALTPQADAYSFGAVFYRTLTGKPVFEGENDQAVLYQHVYEEPRPPEELNPAVPKAASRLALMLLSKDPALRPTAMSAHAYLEEALWEYRASLATSPRGGLSRSGEYPSGPARPEKLVLHDTLELGGEVAWPGELAAWRNRLWIGAGKGVAKVDLAEKRVTRHNLGDEVSAPPAVKDGTLFASSWDGKLLVFNPSGKLLYSFSTRAEITAAPLLLQDRVYLAGRDGHLYALNRAGELLWAYRAGGHLSASPTFFRGLLFAACEDGWLYALDPASGQLRYKVETGPVHAAMPARSGILIIPTWKGEIHAFDPLLREVRWSFDLEGEIWGAPAMDHERVYVAGWGGRLYALSTKTGDEVWTQNVGKVTAGISLAHGYLYVATEEGKVLAFEAAKGALLFEASGLEAVQAPPLPYHGGLYVASLSGKLYRFAE